MLVYGELNCDATLTGWMKWRHCWMQSYITVCVPLCACLRMCVAIWRCMKRLDQPRGQIAAAKLTVSSINDRWPLLASVQQMNLDLFHLVFHGRIEYLALRPLGCIRRALNVSGYRCSSRRRRWRHTACV